MLPLGLGRNSAGLLRALRTPIHVPRDCPTPQVQASSPGGGTCAGSLVESGSVGASPGALRACLPAHFFAALRGRSPNPSLRGKVGALRRSLLRQMPDALTGGMLGLRGVRLRSTAGGRGCASFLPCLPCADSCAPAGVRLRAPGSGFPGDVPATSWRRRSAAESSPDFSAFPAGWRKRHAAGKALSPARSRKRAECGRPGLPHSG